MTFRTYKAALAFVVALLCCTGSLRADFVSLYDGSLLPDDPDATDAAPSDLSYGRRYASPFSLSQTHSAGSTDLTLTYWGGLRLGGETSLPVGGFSMVDPLDFRFRIYTAGPGGVPNVLIWDQISTVGSVDEIYRENFFDGVRWWTKSYHEYQVSLSGLPELLAGQTYLLEVADRDPQTAGPGDTEAAWQWLASANAYNEYFRSAPGIDMQSWIGSGLDHSRAFALEVTPVPEPGSLLILGCAGIGFAGLRRRSRRRTNIASPLS